MAAGANLFRRQVSRAAALCLVGALSAAAFAASDEHRAPVENLAAPQARSKDAARQALLSEMWQRRILSSESQSWDAEDLDLLLKIRAAEQLNAVELLRRRIDGPLGDLAVPYTAPGSSLSLLRLTKAGYERWRFFRSQDAIDYFTDKGVDSGLAFRLVDLDGRKLFDGDGLLTAAGDEVYNRALANLPVWWKLPTSPELFGTRPPSQAKQASQPQAPPALDAYPVTIGPEHAALMQSLGAKYGRSYQPQLRVTELGRLRVVMEYEPSNAGGSDAYIVVVSRKKDKAAARRELEKEVPALGVVPFDKILTVKEKLAGMERNLKRLSKQAGGELSLDRSAVEKQLRELLKGKLAVAWVLSNAEPPVEAEPAPQAAPAPGAGASGGSSIQTAPESATEPAPPDVSAPPQPQAPPPQDKP